MAYREDKDLEFLAKASNEDLVLLAHALIYKDADHKAKNSPRLAATLHKNEHYKACYPNYMREAWREIAEELQKFGGHTGVNLLFRGNKGVSYREILKDVCKLQKVKNVNFKKDSITHIENEFLKKTVELAIEKMSAKDREELINGLRNVEGFKDFLKNKVITPENLIDLVTAAFKVGGFKSYILTLQVVNGISRTVIGRGLAFSANAALMQTIGQYMKIMTGPWGWAFTIVTTAWDLMGPNKDATLKAVAIIAYMRKKMMLGY